MNTPAEWLFVVHLSALAIPASFALAAVTAPRRAVLASALALGLTLLFTVGVALTQEALPSSATNLGVRDDAVTCVMLMLVSSIGLVITRYSVTYLDGESGLTRYLRWLLLTLGAVAALVITNNLLVVALGWTATSLALHKLLTFYPNRTSALIAAHKKFLVSRLADLCLVGCLMLVYGTVGSLDLDQIAAWAESHPDLTASMHVAAVLVVIAVALKSAQLPFHGWLTQVMEAPTPVSALLHAGVVNIGGFVLIRLAPWLSHAQPAQLLLVVIGLTSAIVGALVMTTRVSVKVALAWSTCAQMGFMLVQCGLGAWDLALLHLVAHSLYKAHAFLSTGTAVEGFRLQAMTRSPPTPSWGRLGISAAVGLGSTALGVFLLKHTFEWSPTAAGLSTPVLATLVGLSLVPLLSREVGGFASVAAIAARIAAVVLLYVGWHAIAGHVLPSSAETSNSIGWLLVGAGFLGLFVVKGTLELLPNGRLARTLYPWLFAGLYLDERFTRLTFRIWPPIFHHESASPGSIQLKTLEAQT